MFDQIVLFKLNLNKCINARRISFQDTDHGISWFWLKNKNQDHLVPSTEKRAFSVQNSMQLTIIYPENKNYNINLNLYCFLGFALRLLSSKRLWEHHYCWMLTLAQILHRGINKNHIFSESEKDSQIIKINPTRFHFKRNKNRIMSTSTHHSSFISPWFHNSPQAKEFIKMSFCRWLMCSFSSTWTDNS
jgi:hypothetical protein